jgi:hypothetical protein
MNIRKFIREEISRVFREDATDDILGGAVNDIGTMLQADIENINGIIDTQRTNLKNDKLVYKQDSQKKGAISPKIGNIDNPEKKGLERELPLVNQLNMEKEKQIKDLENAQKGLATAKIDLDKKQAEIEKQSKMQAKNSGKEQTASVLPSLQSPI